MKGKNEKINYGKGEKRTAKKQKTNCASGGKLLKKFDQNFKMALRARVF
ncbi:hypothetical protein [Desulfatibacillum aliphaticivorans]|nr:hypothetical protein [Desulfatibacillum aliphaticivorans]